MLRLVKPIALIFLFCPVVLLNACSSDDDNSSSSANSAQTASPLAGVTLSPVDVITDFVQRISPPDVPDTQSNRLLNGGFENGTQDWVGCGAGTISEVYVAYDGEKALQLSPGNCFYQSVQVTPGEDLVLSCYARLGGGNDWTGMGMGFSDADWTLVSETPATLINGSNYARYDVRAQVPAEASIATMWFYSETPATVDSCSLLPADLAPPPPLLTDVNLLENADFDTTNGGIPGDWQLYCDGSITARDTNGDIYVSPAEGACISQSLSASDLSAMQNAVYEYSCDITLASNQYAAISMNLDGVETVEVIPPNADSKVRLSVLGPDSITSGYVGIYSEASSNMLRVYSCALTKFDSGSGQNQVNPEDNLLVNGSFDEVDAQNKPQAWTKGCSGTWSSIDSSFSDAALEISEENAYSCVQQELSEEVVAVLRENTYTISCDAWNYSSNGWASVVLKHSGKEFRHYIDNTGFYEPVTFTGELSYFEQASFEIYAARGLRIDNCSLQAGQMPSTGNMPSVDIRANVKGEDVYRTSGPLTFDVVVTNNGNQPLTDVSFRDNDDICIGTTTVLQPGESFVNQCTNPRTSTRESGKQVMDFTATAFTNDSSQVTDTDSIGHLLSIRPDLGFFLSIKARQRTIAAGEDAVFVVSFASTGAFTGVHGIESDQAACEKSYDPVLNLGQYDIYECVVPNVSSSMTVTVNGITRCGETTTTCVADSVVSDTASVTVE